MKNLQFIFFALILLLVFSGNAHAIGWNDEAWTRSGCSKNILGQWISESHSPFAGSRMIVDPNTIMIAFEDAKTKEFRYTSTSRNVKDRKYIELEITSFSDESKHPRFYRIRPHLVRNFQQSSDDADNRPQCLIKVFRYESKKNISQDKYMSWDIYRKE